jgi:RNA polymerase sigma factor (sigma-70 family)
MVSVVSTQVDLERRETTAFERLFIREYGRVVAVARRVLGDPQEAEDVAQEVFCSFYRNHEPEAPYAAAWLHRAAAHTALNVLRGKRRRKSREASDAVDRDRMDVGAGAALDPQRAVVLAEQRQEVQSALSRLSPKYAAVLALRYSGLSYAEVATALGMGIGQVGTQLRRAEAALKKEMTRVAPQ